MKIEVLADADAVARAGAAFVAGEARAAVAARGRFTVAFSGGRTPWVMLQALAEMTDVPWKDVHLFQVDERIAPAGDADRNLTHLAESLLDRAPLAAGRCTRCRSRFPTPPRRPRATPRRCARSQVHRRCSTSSTSGSAPTGTPLRSCRAIRCSRPATRTSR